MDLSQMRARLRKDLHDEDSANYRWNDSELDRHLQHALRDLSLSIPLEAKATLQTSAGSRELSMASLSDLLWIEAVEYPAGDYPPSYVRFSLWGTTLTLLVEGSPAQGESVNLYYNKLHTLDTQGSTIPSSFEDLVVVGAGAYAALEWASFATNRLNLGGSSTWEAYLLWGQKQMSAFQSALAKHGARHRVRARRLYTPAIPPKSQTKDWGP